MESKEKTANKALAHKNKSVIKDLEAAKKDNERLVEVVRELNAKLVESEQREQAMQETIEIYKQKLYEHDGLLVSAERIIRHHTDLSNLKEEKHSVVDNLNTLITQFKDNIRKLHDDIYEYSVNLKKAKDSRDSLVFTINSHNSLPFYKRFKKISL